MRTSLWQVLKEEWQFYRYAEEPVGRLSPLKSPGFWVMANYRYGRWALGVRIPVIGFLLRACYAIAKLAVSALSGVDLRIGAIVGKRLHIHTWFGIVVADGVVIGDDCTINCGVCLVHAANSKGMGTPVIGNVTRLGVGSKVIGPVTIGDFSIVGANAVVTRNVPPGHVAIGVPAVCKPVPQEYVEGYLDPENPLRKLGLLPDRPRPQVTEAPRRRRRSVLLRGKTFIYESAIGCSWLIDMHWLAPVCAL